MVVALRANLRKTGFLPPKEIRRIVVEMQKEVLCSATRILKCHLAEQ